MRREIGKWVDDAKGAEVRQKRAEKIAERMLLAMEGEQQPPPILRRIFQREPKAEAGWNLLTPTQRRMSYSGFSITKQWKRGSAGPRKQSTLRSRHSRKLQEQIQGRTPDSEILATHIISFFLP